MGLASAAQTRQAQMKGKRKTNRSRTEYPMNALGQILDERAGGLFNWTWGAARRVAPPQNFATIFKYATRRIRLF
jgi:hypothetical protein